MARGGESGDDGAAGGEGRSDDIIFPVISLGILAVVVYGFAESYFLAGMGWCGRSSRMLWCILKRVHRSTYIPYALMAVMAVTLPAVLGQRLFISVWIGDTRVAGVV